MTMTFVAGKRRPFVVERGPPPQHDLSRRGAGLLGPRREGRAPPGPVLCGSVWRVPGSCRGFRRRRARRFRRRKRVGEGRKAARQAAGCFGGEKVGGVDGLGWLGFLRD